MLAENKRIILTIDEYPHVARTSKSLASTLQINMFYFWYRFVFDNNSVIARGVADMVYKRIKPQLPNYMGRVFEEICMQYLWKQLIEGNAPIEFISLGCWWRNENVDLNVLETLVGRSKLFCYTKVHYYLFSKSDFTKSCIEKAKEMENVTLVTYADIIFKSKKIDIK